MPSIIRSKSPTLTVAPVKTLLLLSLLSLDPFEPDDTLGECLFSLEEFGVNVGVVDGDKPIIGDDLPSLGVGVEVGDGEFEELLELEEFWLGDGGEVTIIGSPFFPSDGSGGGGDGDGGDGGLVDESP